VGWLCGVDMFGDKQGCGRLWARDLLAATEQVGRIEGAAAMEVLLTAVVAQPHQRHDGSWVTTVEGSWMKQESGHTEEGASGSR
jgi:hypothetical protein